VHSVLGKQKERNSKEGQPKNFKVTAMDRVLCQQAGNWFWWKRQLLVERQFLGGKFQLH
jgi:hypothetical protein